MKLINGQTIYDIAIQHYNNVDAAFAIFQANPNLFVDGFTTELVAGSELILPDLQLVKNKSFIIEIKQSVMNEIRTFAGQTIFDIAIQEFGSTNEVFQIIKDNSEIFDNGITTILIPGTLLKIRNDLKLSKPRIAAYYKKKGIKVSSNFFEEIAESNWILATGKWNMSGIWINNELWKLN